jgi:hypothetical protein
MLLFLTEENAVDLHSEKGGLTGYNKGRVGIPQLQSLPRSTANSAGNDCSRYSFFILGR